MQLIKGSQTHNVHRARSSYATFESPRITLTDRALDQSRFFFYYLYMGLTESGLKIMIMPCTTCMTHVLGNIDCGVSCCDGEGFKCHCKTKDDYDDDELYVRKVKSCYF